MYEVYEGTRVKMHTFKSYLANLPPSTVGVAYFATTAVARLSLVNILNIETESFWVCFKTIYEDEQTQSQEE